MAGRPLRRRRRGHSPSGPIYYPIAYDLCGAVNGQSPPVTEAHHAALLPAMSPIPDVEPGDPVWWHADAVHSVAPVTDQKGWGNVMYIPDAPHCARNAAYARRCGQAFLASSDSVRRAESRRAHMKLRVCSAESSAASSGGKPRRASRCLRPSSPRAQVHPQCRAAAEHVHLRPLPQRPRDQQVGAPLEAEPAKVERGAAGHGRYSPAVTMPWLS